MCFFKNCTEAKPLPPQPEFSHTTPVPIGDSGLMLLGAILGVVALKFIKR